MGSVVEGGHGSYLIRIHAGIWMPIRQAEANPTLRRNRNDGQNSENIFKETADYPTMGGDVGGAGGAGERWEGQKSGTEKRVGQGNVWGLATIPPTVQPADQDARADRK